MAYITVLGYLCERCDHRWMPKQFLTPDPKVCPKCKSENWNRPRTKAKRQMQAIQPVTAELTEAA